VVAAYAEHCRSRLHGMESSQFESMCMAAFPQWSVAGNTCCREPACQSSADASFKLGLRWGLAAWLPSSSVARHAPLWNAAINLAPEGATGGYLRGGIGSLHHASVPIACTAFSFAYFQFPKQEDDKMPATRHMSSREALTPVQPIWPTGGVWGHCIYMHACPVPLMTPPPAHTCMMK